MVTPTTTTTTEAASKVISSHALRLPVHPILLGLAGLAGVAVLLIGVAADFIGIALGRICCRGACTALLVVWGVVRATSWLWRRLRLSRWSSALCQFGLAGCIRYRSWSELKAFVEADYKLVGGRWWSWTRSTCGGRPRRGSALPK